MTDLLPGYCTQDTSTVKNFTKFLVGRNGEIVGRFEPKVKPEEIAPPIDAELKKK